MKTKNRRKEIYAGFAFAGRDGWVRRLKGVNPGRSPRSGFNTDNYRGA